MVRFIRFQEEHLSLLRKWLSQDHIKPFWQEPESEQDLKDKFLKKLPLRGVTSFIIEHEGNLIGYIQYYDAKKVGGGWWENENSGTFGIDLMIGEKTHVGKGLGAKIITNFISYLRTQESNVSSIIIDPEPTNERAIKAFERAGFKRESEITTPDGKALLMRITLTF